MKNNTLSGHTQNAVLKVPSHEISYYFVLNLKSVLLKLALKVFKSCLWVMCMLN
jgi:hypothetical protein